MKKEVKVDGTGKPGRLFEAWQCSALRLCCRANLRASEAEVSCGFFHNNQRARLATGFDIGMKGTPRGSQRIHIIRSLLQAQLSS